jgi:UDP-N-acetylmuramyl pentapeptide phosphotransferase/UDP-N-acetylglucosamine-1-phosphate transferase
MSWLSIFATAFALSYAVIAFMLRSGRVGPMDAPNARSLHTAPIPRSGGLGVLAALLAGVVADGAWVLAAALAAVATVSWLDDRHNLPAAWRFAVHFLAAGVLAVFGLLPDWGAWGVVPLVIGVVWLTNLYNFMDGANGLAGGMALFGFGALGLAASQAGGTLSYVALAAAGGAVGFLVFNFHPARIFMGDVGSIPLGFLAGALGLFGVRDGLWPLAFPLLVFSPFIVDATLTLARRALRGEKIWQAHREHYYQRLVQSGWSHRRVALAYYVVMLLASASALTLRLQPPVIWLYALSLWGLAYLAIARIIDRHWQRYLQTRKP